jgi:hypothetical protein
LVVPVANEEGVGAVPEPGPLTVLVYQSNVEPVAVNCVVAAPTQYNTGLVTVGCALAAFTFTSNVAGLLAQPVTVETDSIL